MTAVFDIAFPVLGATAAAFAVWQIVAIVNQRQNRRVCVWTGVVLIVFMAYVISFGPAYWWLRSSGSSVIPVVYLPLTEAAWRSPRFVLNGLSWYACRGQPDNMRLGCAPMWRDGPRAFSWVTITIENEPAQASLRSASPRLKGSQR
ncbi:MAG: hypothetical protein EHM42_10915 [Planctomycetaceae bacterium]|nr:MAG: hypothetical protein EHM42_10915 [Planctomycetaceae bacterium]